MKEYLKTNLQCFRRIWKTMKSFVIYHIPMLSIFISIINCKTYLVETNSNKEFNDVMDANSTIGQDFSDSILGCVANSESYYLMKCV